MLMAIVCKLSVYPLNRPSSKVVTVTQWCQEKVDISVQGGERRVSTITIKKDIQMKEDELVAQFQDRLFIFMKHLFNIHWEHNAYTNVRESLTAKDALIHIDFSENYSCKLSNEIQSVHFRDHISRCLSTLECFIWKTRPQCPSACPTPSLFL